MERHRRVLILSLAIMLALPTVAGAQSGGPYDLTWSSIDGGGHTFSAGGDYALGGTAGQPDAGVMTGGDYTLGGGFWGGGAVESGPTHDIFLPLVLRN
jgi:hypothetical protein